MFTYSGNNPTFPKFTYLLPIPPVEARYRLLQEYHQAPIAGHRGIKIRPIAK